MFRKKGSRRKPLISTLPFLSTSKRFGKKRNFYDHNNFLGLGRRNRQNPARAMTASPRIIAAMTGQEGRILFNTSEEERRLTSLTALPSFFIRNLSTTYPFFIGATQNF